MPNIQDLNFNKNVSMVYVEEPGFTGYRGFDFTKIDEVETKLTSLQTAINSGLSFGINVHQDDLNYLVDSVNARGPYVEGINNKIFATGDSFPGGVQGTIVFQADLSSQFDNVDIAGYAGADISGIFRKLQDGIQVSLTGINTVNVNVTGGNLNVLNEVEIKNDDDNPIPVTGLIDISTLPSVTLAANQNVGVTGFVNILSSDITSLKNSLDSLIFSDINVPSGIVVYQSNLNKDLDNVSTSPVQSSTISNSTISGSNGTILEANENRLELYVQNLATGALYIKYGTNASSTSFNFVLPGNTYQNAGDGGSLSDQAYTGSVSVFSLTTPSYISWERS